MKLKTWYLVAGDGAWQVAETLDEALTGWKKRHCGSKTATPQYQREVIQPASAPAPWVDDLGRIYWHEDAEINRV